MALRELTVDNAPRRNQNLCGGISEPIWPEVLTHHVEFTTDATLQGAPPSYEEAMDPACASPPSYESLFGRLREMHKESSGTMDFVKNVIFLLDATIWCTVIVGITIVVPVFMTIVGSMYLFDCPINYRIPVYLLIGGSCGISKQILHVVRRCKRRNCSFNMEDEENNSTFQNGFSCFIMGWFILGSFWVYKEYEPNYDSSKGPYCNRTVYLFAFWQITSIYIMLGVLSLCLCSVSLAVIAFAKKHIHIASPS